MSGIADYGFKVHDAGWIRCAVSPLILTHGWPGSPLEFLKVIGP